METAGNFDPDMEDGDQEAQNQPATTYICGGTNSHPNIFSRLWKAEQTKCEVNDQMSTLWAQNLLQTKREKAIAV